MNSQPGARLIKNSVNSLINKLFTLVTTWIISIWVARQLGPENYGIFSLVLWFTGIFSWMTAMGLTHAVTKFIAEFHGRGDDATLSAIILFVLKVELALSAAVTVVLIVFKSGIADYFFTPKESFYFFLAFLGLIPGILTAIFSATIEGIQKFEYFTYATLTISPFAFVSKILVLALGGGVEGLLVVMLVFSFINTLYYCWVLRKEKILFVRGIGGIGKELKRRVLKYNFSVCGILLCDKIVWDKSENFFLGRFCEARQIAYYNLGFNLAQKFVSILPATFWSVLFPAMSGYFGTDRMKRLFFISTRYLAFFTFPVSVGGIILAYPIIHYLYGHEYIGAQRVLQVIFFSLIFSSLANPGSAILYGFEKQSFIYKFGAILAVLNIGIDIIFVPRYGAIGAASCYAVITIIASVFGLWYTCRTMRLRYPFVSVFKIAFSTIIMGTAMQLVVLKNAEIPGFIIAIVSGGIVYLICSLVLGTFEEEDYRLLESVKAVLPPRGQKIVGAASALIAEFKNGKS
jgi:O-antigen/teichoic acid export membrane protein